MKDNDKVLFRNITADEKTRELIRKWMENAEMKYPCFTQVLETANMKGPFNITFDSYTTTLLTIRCSTDNGEYYVYLYFGDTDSHPEIEIADCTGKHTKWYNYTIKEGKISLS